MNLVIITNSKDIAEDIITNQKQIIYYKINCWYGGGCGCGDGVSCGSGNGCGLIMLVFLQRAAVDGWCSWGLQVVSLCQLLIWWSDEQSLHVPHIVLGVFLESLFTKQYTKIEFTEKWGFFKTALKITICT